MIVFTLSSSSDATSTPNTPHVSTLSSSLDATSTPITPHTVSFMSVESASDKSVVINDPVLASTSVNTNESEQDLNLSFDGNVTNISLTFPLLSDVVDLPLSIGNDDVLVCTADKESEDQESVLDNVSDEKALEVIESALTSETLAKYCAAYLSCIHINDQLYDTWKMYKTKCNKANASKSLSVQQLVDELHPLL